MQSRRTSRKFTVMVQKGNKIEMKKYKRVEDITGAHLNIDINSLIERPPGFNHSDWLIVNLVDFLQRVELLYSSCSLFCTSDTCPMFNTGPQFCYFWLDDDSPKPIQMSAPEYFDALKRYIKRNLQNKELFPIESNELSQKAGNVLKNSYRRLFRILAHLYICHFKDISNINYIDLFEVMNTVLAHYVNIALINRICQMEEFSVFAPILKAINEHSTSNFYCPKFSASELEKLLLLTLEI